jgi:YggT family protein
MAEGYPVVLKQFIQFCLIIIYPGWVFFVIVAAALHALFYVTVYPVLWVLFWPMRAYQKENPTQRNTPSRRGRSSGLKSGTVQSLVQRTSDGDA